MADSVVLDCPSSHAVYVDSEGEPYGGPLAGTIHTSSQTLDSLQVALVRTIQISPYASTIPTKKPTRLRTSLSFRKPKQTPKQTPASASFQQEILRCNLSTTPASSRTHPDDLVTHSFLFALPSPLHQPESIPGPGLDVSYNLIARATTCNGQNLAHSQPLRLIRRRLPDPWDIVTHTRGFPKSNVKLELTLLPQLSASGQCTHYSGDIQLRNVALPGTRPSEWTALVVEKLSWRLDEIITLETKTSETTTQTRDLAHSAKKGRWPAVGNVDLHGPLSEQSFEDMAISIPIEINLGKDSHAINDITITDPDSPSLTVRHQVTVELVTGRETISRDTGSLVARRSSVQGFGATIPVPLHSYADAADFLKMMDADAALLPGYEKVATAPPEYKEVVDCGY